MRGQNSPQGLFSKNAIEVDNLFMRDYSITTAMLTANSTGAVLAGGLSISASQQLTANSSGIIHGDPVAALPTADHGVAWTVVSNSTGVAICVNTTGTTWKFLNVTTDQPT